VGNDHYHLALSVNGVQVWSKNWTYPQVQFVNAECIVENTAGNYEIPLPYPDYGTATFTSCTAAQNGAPSGPQIGSGGQNGYSVFRINTTWGNSTNAVTSVPSSGGAPWSVTWTGTLSDSNSQESPRNGPVLTCDERTGLQPLGGSTAIADSSREGCPGYYVVSNAGVVRAFGDARWFGDLRGSHLNAPITQIVPTPDGGGYWLLGSDGGVFSFGDALFFGSMGGRRLNAPVIAMATTPDGQGYWLVARDGGVFSFGDAKYHGSTGSIRLNSPVVGLGAAPDGSGYWLVASDGGVFTFTRDRYFGSLGSAHLNAPIIGIDSTTNGGGYTLVATDGGVFGFGNAQYFGSLPGLHISTSAVGIGTNGDGYYVLAANGAVYGFGPGAPYLGGAN
jgi:hypothetical protein